VLNTDNVYVVHYTRLIERRQRLEGFFRNNDIKANYIFNYDREALTEEIINDYYLFSQDAYEERVNSVYKERSSPFRPMSKAEISCTIKHYEAIKRLGNECSNHGLIFEDDVVFPFNFVSMFNSYPKQTPDDWDAIFMGSCCEMKIAPQNHGEKQVAFLKSHPATKCADAYLLRTNLAKKITQTMKPFVVISDWELACQLSQHDANVYWWEPALISQGTETGLFNTTLGCMKCGKRGCEEHVED